jgi:predicted outer membrane protein
LELRTLAALILLGVTACAEHADHERVLVLLQLLGGERPVELARGAIEAL